MSRSRSSPETESALPPVSSYNFPTVADVALLDTQQIRCRLADDVGRPGSLSGTQDAVARRVSLQPVPGRCRLGRPHADRRPLVGLTIGRRVASRPVRLNRCFEPLIETHRGMDREKLTVYRPNRADPVVREDQRGKGWGRLIYRILAHLGETKGAVCILAACRNDNTDGQAFYRTIGCDSTPLRDGET
jgi:hypothetical protein